MRSLLFIMTALFASVAQASLITLSTDRNSYGDGSTVTVEVLVNEINPDIDFLQFEIEYNIDQLELDHFSWVDSTTVQNNTSITAGDAGINFTSSTYPVVITLSGLSELLDQGFSSFSAGTFTFAAQEDIHRVRLTADNFFAQNADSERVKQFQVNAPSLAWLASIAAFGFLVRARKQK